MVHIGGDVCQVRAGKRSDHGGGDRLSPRSPFILGSARYEDMEFLRQAEIFRATLKCDGCCLVAWDLSPKFAALGFLGGAQSVYLSRENRISLGATDMIYLVAPSESNFRGVSASYLCRQLESFR